MRDDGPSTDPDLSVPLRSLPSPWERHLSLASCDDMKLPTLDPGTGTKISSTLSRHVSITAWPWLCEKGLPLRENPLVLSHHCRGLMYNSPKAVTLDAAAIRPNSLWNCLQWVTGLALYFLQLTGWTLYVPVTGAPASTLSPISRPGKWSSVMEKAHFSCRLAVTPIFSCGQERHLDAELPTDATELESTNRQCSS